MGKKQLIEIKLPHVEIGNIDENGKVVIDKVLEGIKSIAIYTPHDTSYLCDN